jgi:hypothetical protein
VNLAFKDIVLLRLFLVSYAPLAVILAVQNSTETWPVEASLAFWIPAAIGAYGLLDAFRLPRGALRKGGRPVEFGDVTEEGGQVAAYIATYLLPFLSLNLLGWRAWVSIVIYLLVLLVVFVQSDLALVNPALYLMGWRVVGAHHAGRRVLVLVPSSQSVSAGCWPVVAFGRFYIYKEDP